MFLFEGGKKRNVQANQKRTHQSRDSSHPKLTPTS